MLYEHIRYVCMFTWLWFAAFDREIFQKLKKIRKI